MTAHTGGALGFNSIALLVWTASVSRVFALDASLRSFFVVHHYKGVMKEYLEFWKWHVTVI